MKKTICDICGSEFTSKDIGAITFTRGSVKVLICLSVDVADVDVCDCCIYDTVVQGDLREDASLKLEMRHKRHR